MREKATKTLAALTGTVVTALVARALLRDSTLALLAEGYTFIPRRCQRYQSDIFETRLLLTKVICTVGQEAAEVFYEPGRFTRRGALPQTTLRLLQDLGSAQVMDGEAHRLRKQVFMSLMTRMGIQRLGDVMADKWRADVGKWEGMDRVVLFHEVQEILYRAVCEWAGVLLSDSKAKQRAREFAAMVDGAGSVGPRNWRAQLLRAHGAVDKRRHREGSCRRAGGRRGKCRSRHSLAPRSTR